jgi:hypothetical protein
MKWCVTGRRSEAPTDAIMGKTRPVEIDGAGSLLTVWANARGVWVCVNQTDKSRWIEIAVNPEAPPR